MRQFIIVIIVSLCSIPLYGQELFLTQSLSNNSPDAGEPFEFIINISCNNTTSNCNNTEINGVLPDELDFIRFSSPLPSGVASATYDQITRSYRISFDDAPIGALGNGSSIQILLQAEFPPFSIIGSSATNRITATSSNATEAQSEQSVTIGPGGEQIDPSIFQSRKTSDSIQTAGGQQYWQVRFGNGGLAPIDNYQILDTIPEVVDIYQLRTPEFPFIDHPAQLYYRASNDPSTWMLWTDFNLNNRQILDIIGLGLPADVRIEQLRFDFGDVPASAIYNVDRYPNNFRSEIGLYGTIDSTLAVGFIYENCADYLGLNGTGDIITDRVCASTMISDGAEADRIDGAVHFTDQVRTQITTALIGDTISIEHIYNSPPFMTFDVYGGVMSVVLPVGVSYVPGTLRETFSCTQFDGQLPVIEVSTTVDGRQIVRFVYHASFGNEFVIEADGTWAGCGFLFDILIGNSAIEGINTVDYFFNATGSTHASCNNPDTENLLGGYATDFCEFRSDQIEIFRGLGSAGIRAEKSAIGTIDTDYSQYPNTSTTVPGGIADYRITITNPNTTPLDNITVIDILPNVDDRHILNDNLQRFSAWKPNLAAPIGSLPGITVSYTTIDNPCRDELAGSNPTPYPAGCNDPNWSITPPVDITDVTALKFDLTSITLNQNDSIVLDVQMRAPVNAPTSGEIAWNSFAYTSRNLTTGQDLLPTEAIKVGIQSLPGSSPRVGDFVWDDLNGNGLQDSGEPGLDGIKVELYRDTNANGMADLSSGDNLVANTITADGGLYRFSNISAGEYFVIFTGLPAVYSITPTNQGSDDSLDSDGLLVGPITITGTSNIENVDLGLFNGAPPTSIEVCNDNIDNDGDGLIDFNDPECDCPAFFANPITLDFSNVSTLSGTGLNEGDQLLYSDVGNIQGNSVDIIATIASLTNIMALEEHGAASGSDNAIVILPSMRETQGTEYYADIRYDLVQSGTNIPISGTFEIEIADIDSISTARVEIVGASQEELNIYLLDNATNLTISSDGQYLSLTGTADQNADDPQGAVRFTYIDRSTFKLRYGVRQHLRTSSGDAAFVIDGNSIDILGSCLDDVLCDNGILSNNQFDQGLTDWTDHGNSFVSSDAFIGNNALIVNGGTGAASQRIPVLPGETYRLRFYAKTEGGTRAEGSLEVVDALDRIIASNERQVFEDIYEEHTTTLTIPPNATHLDVVLSINGPAGSATFDAVCLELINTICDLGSEPDLDQDGVCNALDIDDDNDGLRDSDEYNCRGVFSSMIWWSHNTPPNTREADILDSQLVASAQLEEYGSGITANIVSTQLNIIGVDQLDLSDAIADEDYLQYTLTTAADINAMFLHSFSFTKSGLNNVVVRDNFGYDFSILISDDNFTTSQLISDVFTVDDNINPTRTTQIQESDDNQYLFHPDQTYSFRVYFYNKTTDLSVDTWYDDFRINVEVCEFNIDVDNDTYVNSRDLDSDNDGLTDLIESGHLAADTNNDGVIDGVIASTGLNGLYDPLETVIDIGVINYTISDSEAISDRIYDPYELDSDDDGCNDAREESITDPDDDGVVGTGAPSVDTDGLVIGFTYSPPPNNFWQDNSLIKCLDISGLVFEDINYGGGIGRDYVTADISAQSSSWVSDDIALDNVLVELYGSGGNYIGNTITDASGRYNFGDVGSGSFIVRMVSNSVVSNRSSNSTGRAILPVQTYRHDGISPFASEVGGADPSREDAGPNTSDANLSSLTTLSTIAQSVTQISVGTSDLAGIDFGVNYDIIVNTNDSGQGSVRQFIDNSNELSNLNLDQDDSPLGGVSFTKPPGVETSIFMIPGSGVQRITNSTVYRSITDDHTHITGYTQEGSTQGDIASRVLNIELTSTTGLIDALRINANSIAISGLSISDYRSGIIGSVAHSDAFIWGNYIGTLSDGITASGNSSNGISVQNFTDSYIGTNSDGINDLHEGNLISANSQGVQIRNTSNIWIAGNIIGLDKNGVIAIGNDFNGVIVRDALARNIIGYNGAIAPQASDLYRNIISANGNDAIRIANSSDQIVSGNYLGTDISGTIGRGNTNFGVQLQGSSSDNLIGTDGDGDDDQNEGNIISANGSGIRMQVGGTGRNNIISGNFIGTDVSGNIALGNTANGVDITGGFGGNIIGTNGDNINDGVERNVISANGGDGIRLFNTNDNTVAGNFIGVGADRMSILGNDMRGIFITGTSSSSVIGYHQGMSNNDEFVVGNCIKNNGDMGVGLSGDGTQNRISRNQTANNGALGIDLGFDNVTSNDNGDIDSGANNLQNFPVFSFASLRDDNLTINGFAPANAVIEVFVGDVGPNPNPLPASFSTSFGEGAIYLFDVIEGSAADLNNSLGVYNNDGTGIIANRTSSRFQFVVDVSGLGLVDGMFITATATDADNNTSEFSGVIEITTNCGTAIMNPHVLYIRSR